MGFLTKHRVAFAFLLTPVICVTALWSAAMLATLAKDGTPGHAFKRGSLEDIVFFIVVLWVVSAFFALPLFLVLRAVNWLRWFHAVAVGAFCGATPCLMIGIDLRGALAAAAGGSAVGLLFWFLALYRNPRYAHKRREPT